MPAKESITPEKAARARARGPDPASIRKAVLAELEDFAELLETSPEQAEKLIHEEAKEYGWPAIPWAVAELRKKIAEEAALPNHIPRDFNNPRSGFSHCCWLFGKDRREAEAKAKRLAEEAEAKAATRARLVKLLRMPSDAQAERFIDEQTAKYNWPIVGRAAEELKERIADGERIKRPDAIFKLMLADFETQRRNRPPGSIDFGDGTYLTRW